MKRASFTALAIACAVACSTKAPHSTTPAAARVFATPSEAADALIRASSPYDVPALLAILGPDGKDLVASKDPVQDRTRASTFAAKAKEKTSVEVDPADPTRATLVVGADDWPLPIPLVKTDGKWHFDAAAGHEELLERRIGANELDVIRTCRGYVEAQLQYASATHDGAGPNQYARRVVSSPGQHDGLAWRNPDGTWGGPVGQRVANAIDQGYAAKEPFHGYYFKPLEGQGPSAPLGKMDYLVGDAMIGGFALVAWPAEYGVTGIQTFIVGYDGIVYQKDLGPSTPSLAAAMDRYDPDATWKRTDDAP